MQIQTDSVYLHYHKQIPIALGICKPSRYREGFFIYKQIFFIPKIFFNIALNDRAFSRNQISRA